MSGVEQKMFSVNEKSLQGNGNISWERKTIKWEANGSYRTEN